MGALRVAGEPRGALGCRLCGSLCHQHPAGAPPASLLSLALSLGIGFQAGISRRAERGGGQRALPCLIPCALLFLLVEQGSGPSPALSRGLGVHAKGTPCHSKGCALESVQFPVSLVSTVSFSNSFLFSLHFAAQIKDSPARRWQGKLIPLLLFA